MVVMPPAVEASTMTSTTSTLTCRGKISYSSEATQGRSLKGSSASCTTLPNIDNCTMAQLWRHDILSSQKSLIPQASLAFRETMFRMKSERSQNGCSNSENEREVCQILPTMSSSPPSPSTSSSLSTSPTSTSLLHKLKSAFKSASSSGNSSRSHSTSPSKGGSSRRPASFGGADVVKPWAGRRASQHEKRVSWADEGGSAHALYSVRLIKPRLSADKKALRQTTPGQSILRNTGLH